MGWWGLGRRGLGKVSKTQERQRSQIYRTGEIWSQCKTPRPKGSRGQLGAAGEFEPPLELREPARVSKRNRRSRMRRPGR